MLIGVMAMSLCIIMVQNLTMPQGGFVAHLECNCIGLKTIVHIFITTLNSKSLIGKLAEIKTKETSASVEDFINTVKDE